LSRFQRIRTPREFKQVYQSKQWGGSDHYSFNVLAHTDNGDPIPRVGITVSKKVAKQAVARNRIKRQIKEFYRHHKQSLLAIDLVITAKPSCAKASDIERQQSLEHLWEKILKWQRWFSAKHSCIKR
ncbi:UNVERIFIED_CONTAM: hypothetical protein GTU68_032395, partial [Idotea baltica]|nr:hypothetical protein [Idotea baltica]